MLKANTQTVDNMEMQCKASTVPRNGRSTRHKTWSRSGKWKSPDSALPLFEPARCYHECRRHDGVTESVLMNKERIDGQKVNGGLIRD